MLCVPLEKCDRDDRAMYHLMLINVTHFELGIGVGRVGHRFYSHRRRHPDRVAAEEAQAHQHDLCVPASEPRCKDLQLRRYNTHYYI